MGIQPFKIFNDVFEDTIPTFVSKGFKLRHDHVCSSACLIIIHYIRFYITSAVRTVSLYTQFTLALKHIKPINLRNTAEKLIVARLVKTLPIFYET